jgi:transposase
MKLWYDYKSKDPTYFIQQGIRNGKKVTTKNVKRIGKHSELLKDHPDPLAYAREQVAEYNRQIKENKVDMTVTVDFDKKVQATDDVVSASTRLNIGYFILQAVYNDLHIHDFFRVASVGTKIEYDPDEINRFLTYARILDPCSKLGTYDNLSTYYEKPEIDYHQILRFMSFLSEHYDAYIEHLFKYSGSVVERDTSVCYYDCTNYYFETEYQDPDLMDTETGEIFRGFRRYGHSKEHRPNPIVQMGLFMDGNGIPITMCITPGSDNEQTTAVPLEEKMAKMFNGKRFIYCADAGLGSYPIRAFNSMAGRAFVVTQSVKKLSAPLQQAVFNDCDYRFLSDGSRCSIKELISAEPLEILERYDDIAYKVITADRLVETGLADEQFLSDCTKKSTRSKGTLHQRIIITFSRKYYDYQRAVRKQQIERAQALVDTKDPEKIKLGNNDIRRFIKRKGKNKDEEYYIDQRAIEKEEKYDGYYAIATNLEDNAKDIIAINANRYKIEDCFRIMKTNFDARPVYHHKEERIRAHFMICYTALLIYRLLEVKLDQYGTHFTTDQIIDTLKNMEVTNVQEMFYQSLYHGSEVCTAFNGLYGLGLDKQYYQPKELNKKIRNLLK